ncbi:acetylglucosaminyltransferase [Bacteroidia bacterium]|nr:acetylglucosaminyltransferase [Bacteroidia bacterium]
MNVALLLTCFNRRQKTEKCLDSLLPVITNSPNHQFDIYLTDDGSSDGTGTMVKEKFPEVNVLTGDGTLFWAGGMRNSWNAALHSGKAYDGYLLINDDVIFASSFWNKIEETIRYAQVTYSKQGLYTLATQDSAAGRLTYGGHKLRKKIFKHSPYAVIPTDIPQECQLTNGNILYASQEVVDTIGILDEHFIHTWGDFDYSLTALEKGFPVLVCPGYGGYCVNDHETGIIPPLKKRIQLLYSSNNIGLNECWYYMCKHFWWKAPFAYVMWWVKTLFPWLLK